MTITGVADEISKPIDFKPANGVRIVRSQAGATRSLDPTLVRALAQARDWARRLETGQVASIDALAKAEKRCERYTTQILPLAYLAPDLATAILEGRQPPLMSLSRLIEEPLPITWAGQRQRFASFL